MQSINIRKAVAEDMNAVHRLVCELAEYEKAPNEVITSPEIFVRDGFGEHPLFGCIVAEVNNEIIGISLYYWRYSTWKGKRLYLEDIIVTEKMRGQKIGHLLFIETVKIALVEHCTGMMWQVLDWNEPGINFYKKYKADFHEDWLNVSLDSDQMKELVN
jgi:GNAT superfamily N-acetyltransferase